MAAYKLITGGVQRRVDGFDILEDAEDPDWIIYLDWLASGLTPDAEDSKDYKMVEGGIQRLYDNALIPDNPDNSDWQAYLDWLDLGNSPDPEYTPQQILDNADREEIIKLKSDLKITMHWLFRMILEVWEVGKDKGLWDNTDITDTELKAKAATWKTKLDRLTELGE